MIKANESIHIYKSDEYPHGYTISKNQGEADDLAKELVNRTTSQGVSVSPGGRHWKTGKYAYWIVSFDAPFELKREYRFVTSIV